MLVYQFESTQATWCFKMDDKSCHVVLATSLGVGGHFDGRELMQHFYQNL